jgi:hypothetical protein
MTWATLHNGETLYGKRIGSVDNLGGMNGLPVQIVLSQLLNKAQGFGLTAVNKGMSFTWARAVVANDVVSIQNEASIVDTANKSAAICHEDRVFPVNPGTGHIVIRQNVAPCARCRAAFRAWAKQRASTIIVAADKGYDSSPDDTVFIFSPTGAAYQWI